MIVECEHVKEAEVQHAQTMSSQGFLVDENLKEWLEYFWERGYETTCSCQGDASVKHGIFGKKHSHYGFIIFKTLEGAVFALESFLEQTDDVVLAPNKQHSSQTEFVVEFPPILKEN